MEWREQYEAGEKPSAYRLKKQFNAICRERFPWSYEVSKCAGDSGFKNLEAAFRDFFRRCKKGDTQKGYPRFKSRRRSCGRFKVDGHWLKLDKLDAPINMAEVLRVAGQVKSVTISEDGGHWYAAVNVEVERPKQEHVQELAGIDLGIKTLAVLSNGTQYENQGLLRSELRKLKRLNRELSRRQERSRRWNRTKKKMAKLQRRIASRRLDYQHQMTTKIARTYRVIGVEDLNVAGMKCNHRLALSIADAGFGETHRQRAYKSEGCGGMLVEIDRFFPSWGLCHVCGCISSDLTLADRTWTCDCGAVPDRDSDAALNIERQALEMVAGEGSRRPKTPGERMSDSSEQSASKRENRAEERRPSKPCQFGTVW